MLFPTFSTNRSLLSIFLLENNRSLFYSPKPISLAIFILIFNPGKL